VPRLRRARASAITTDAATDAAAAAAVAAEPVPALEAAR